MSQPAVDARLTELTAQVVCAYLQRHAASFDGLSGLIRLVHRSLADAVSRDPNHSNPTNQSADEPLVPAVPPARSVFPSHIICLEDGKKYKTLKRHLMAAYRMTPQQYRARWGLPETYPMSAPNYTRKRSEIAKDMGLGRRTDEGFFQQTRASGIVRG